MLKIAIHRIKSGFDDILLPEFATIGSAGMDIRAAVTEPLVIVPGSVALVPTNLAVELPQGYEAQIRSRSGLAAKHGVFCLNSPGTIDSDYRGEIGVILANFGATPFRVERGERVAQMVIAQYERVEWVLSGELSATERGTGGFGSTGRE